MTGAGLTTDAVLGGRLTLTQPARGHRFGHDAVLLAAACPITAGLVVDLGAGIGTAGLVLAVQRPEIRTALVERDTDLAALAAGNAAANGLADRVSVAALDVEAPAAAFAAAGLPPGAAAGVILNPPFSPVTRLAASPDAGRRSAHAAPAGLLARWLRVARRLLPAGGSLTLITRADALAETLAALDGRFGAVEVVPVAPAPGADAIRLLVRARAGRRTPLRLRPALVLETTPGTPTPQADALLRHGVPLDSVL